jgi:hypothetical protein
MGKLYAGVGYLTGRKIAIDSSASTFSRALCPKLKLIPRTKNDP